MINPKISFGEKKVIAAGSLLMPADEHSVRISLDDLDFLLDFQDEADSNSEIRFNGEGKTLRITFGNIQEKNRMGFTKSFLPVGTYNGDTLGLIVTVQFLRSKGKIVDYTFISLGSAKEEADD